MKYEGHNGQITVEGEALILTRDGMMAKAAFGKSPARRIPLQAVSGVSLREATRLQNGWLQLHLGGKQGASLSAVTAPSDGDTVLFTHGKREHWQQLYGWLQTVVEKNRTTGVDPKFVTFDPPKAVLRQEEKRQKGEAAGLRPDIAEAASRLGWQLGGKREIKKLHEHVHPGEAVEYIAQGTYAGNQGIVVLTSTRMLFLFHGIMSQTLEDFPYRSLSSVQSNAGLVTGDLTVHASGNRAVISQIVKQDLKHLADALRERIATGRQPFAPPSPSPSPAASQPDVMDQLRKLGDLRNAGILTQEEFDAKKADLLTRL